MPDININNAVSGAGATPGPGELTITGGETITYTTLGAITINTEGADDTVNVTVANIGNQFTIDGGVGGTDTFNEDLNGATNDLT